jgi:pimeloyl-ACP methyl ester carboxylesterase
VELPETRYANTADGVHIAYQVLGDGSTDLVFAPGTVSHVEIYWENPRLARFLRRLASFARLMVFDKRGTGLSDRVTEAATLEERMDDIRAVMDAAHPSARWCSACRKVPPWRPCSERSIRSAPSG